MARIRTVKPDFWADELVGTFSRDARLLFIATWNLADDEGLLRWTPAYVKSSAFMYDDDLTVDDIARLMRELTDAGVVFAYTGGQARQKLAVVPNFRKHQKINRPQPSKLPAPSLQNRDVREMYGRRDRWTCHVCGDAIPEQPMDDGRWNLVIDHLVPQAEGGHDYPSNVAAAHAGCALGGARQNDGFLTARSVNPAAIRRESALSGSASDSVNGSVNDSVNPRSVAESPETVAERNRNSVNDSVNRSLTNSLPEGKGMEGKGRDLLPPTPHAEPAPAAQPAPEGEGEGNGEEREQRLLDTIRKTRPEWSTNSIRRAIRHEDVRDRPWPIIAAAFTALARDPETKAPGRLAADGPWWADAASATRTGAADLPPPCGECGPNRLLEVPGGLMRCPDCHPLRRTA